MNEIIQLTDKAIEYINKIIKNKSAKAFRLTVKESGCNGLMYLPDVVSTPNDGDLEITINNMQVYIDPNAVKYIEGTTLDVITKELNQTQLVFHNPKVKSSCGCGESFNIEEE